MLSKTDSQQFLIFPPSYIPIVLADTQFIAHKRACRRRHHSMRNRQIQFSYMEFSSQCRRNFTSKHLDICFSNKCSNLMHRNYDYEAPLRSWLWIKFNYLGFFNVQLSLSTEMFFAFHLQWNAVLWLGDEHALSSSIFMYRW